MPSENRILIAIELSRSSWLVAVRLPGGEKSRLHRVEGGDTDRVVGAHRRTAIARCDQARHARMSHAASRPAVMASGCYRLLTAHGVAAYVLEPTSILVNRRARRAKTDRLDAEGMLRVLAAWLGGDRQVCSIVSVPTPEEEDAKRPHREREHLVQERQRIENRMEALLFTQGIRGRPSLRSWERDIAKLRTGDGRMLPCLMQAELNRLRRRLVLILELIHEMEAERAKALPPGGRRDDPENRGPATHPRHRRELLHRAGARGALPLLRQSSSTRQLRGHSAHALPERRNGSRPKH